MRHAVIAGAVVIASAVASAEPAVPAAVQQAIDAAVAMHGYDDRLDVNSTWSNVADAVAALDRCRATIDAAAATGVKLDQVFAVGAEFLPHASAGHSTLALLRGWCEKKAADVQLLRTYVVVKETAKVSAQLRGPELLPRAAMMHRACVREVARAAATKRERAIVFARPDVALVEARDKICEPLGAKVAAAREALPHAAVTLVGDRGKRFAGEQLWAEHVFGPGKVPLATADDFRIATVWYVVLPELDDRGDPRWLVRAHRWDADRLVDSKETFGAGGEPPDEVFK